MHHLCVLCYFFDWIDCSKWLIGVYSGYCSICDEYNYNIRYCDCSKCDELLRKRKVVCSANNSLLSCQDCRSHFIDMLRDQNWKLELKISAKKRHMSEKMSATERCTIMRNRLRANFEDGHGPYKIPVSRKGLKVSNISCSNPTTDGSMFVSYTIEDNLGNVLLSDVCFRIQYCLF